jgi:hypothetical protein
MAANPFGRTESGYPSQKGKTELVTIPKGESMKFTFAIYTHAGDVKSGQVAEVFREFAKR